MTSRWEETAGEERGTAETAGEEGGTSEKDRSRTLSMDGGEGDKGDERHRSGDCSVEDPHADADW
ncbi:hypothetical protein ACHAW5_005618 [Stephanodiscus triporus]|uniref:Uncharacterized protein n=1 Tax=Stephanodiscus triporus TaxID=2934178 RepID=A0ABD3NX36_9STRA